MRLFSGWRRCQKEFSEQSLTERNAGTEDYCVSVNHNPDDQPESILHEKEPLVQTDLHVDKIVTNPALTRALNETVHEKLPGSLTDSYRPSNTDDVDRRRTRSCSSASKKTEKCTDADPLSKRTKMENSNKNPSIKAIKLIRMGNDKNPIYTIPKSPNSIKSLKKTKQNEPKKIRKKRSTLKASSNLWETPMINKDVLKLQIIKINSTDGFRIVGRENYEKNLPENAYEYPSAYPNFSESTQSSPSGPISRSHRKVKRLNKTRLEAKNFFVFKIYCIVMKLMTNLGF